MSFKRAWRELVGAVDERAEARAEELHESQMAYNRLRVAELERERDARELEASERAATQQAAYGPPQRRDPCPDCGCAYFTPGGQTVAHESNGETSRLEPVSAVLSCLGCGARWYGTPSGLKRPHEAALPPAWAVADMQARAKAAHDAKAREQAARQQPDREPQGGPRSTSRNPAEGFRKPPKPR